MKGVERNIIGKSNFKRVWKGISQNNVLRAMLKFSFPFQLLPLRSCVIVPLSALYPSCTQSHVKILATGKNNAAARTQTDDIAPKGHRDACAS
jgi:hypothetical protein